MSFHFNELDPKMSAKTNTVDYVFSCEMVFFLHVCNIFNLIFKWLNFNWIHFLHCVEIQFLYIQTISFIILHCLCKMTQYIWGKKEKDSQVLSYSIISCQLSMHSSCYEWNEGIWGCRYWRWWCREGELCDSAWCNPIS